MRIREDNRGLSLVELLAVIAIISIAGAVTVWGLNAVSGRPAQQMAQKLIYSMERHRISAMGKVDSYYTIRIDGTTGAVVCEEGVKNSADPTAVYSVTTAELGTKRVTIFYEDAGGALVKMNPGDSLTFKFNRESGGFTTMPATRLIAKSGGREVKVKLVKVTGKVYLE